ncbi:fumarate hydratase [Chlamydia pneumoniae TW-183]|uniref:Fumarate hydratase class II n=2 Tax=Chlamydia pneumoniae TaxID=83558 RepID=FUMC_CHLPN|nr:class II fumarate hydratase [Chlamydia pneumoniae]Q9Z6P6.1 RecName: Full=Fumarate hydratase class II; Short=Fumarase C; AltName: Full=Aerobic fumarase; AltName: Full=Iron-independent fumarase [Chlamydia pneumoniae]AAD19150.1 Fumarate Hydratase [Chlamydia pneumoniae CWL029]AAF38632.1 fumarate hydratase [Chlamydia pneumoniae AR39]AAP98980.1 fumarate hydratase [Chlamydia pneumoniae TW-183]CRI33556.1 Fumarate hydratase class II [Chlamydia pneumoniae]CRI36421.1 Fumarate hydratase class II [Chla
MRQEKDSLGIVEVPEDKLYGAQTMRSRNFFSWGPELMPYEVIRALVWIKKCAAQANQDLGFLDSKHCDMIVAAADEILEGGFEEHFPLKVWQTGSGTQSNMNVNEVIANLAIRHHGGVLGSKDPIHPNDHVNKSQSSNDVFPTAMHIAAVISLKNKLIPALDHMIRVLDAKVEEFRHDVKIGRTHLMDAVPMTLGQEFSGYSSQLRHCLESIAFSLAHLYELAIGATAVGTGLNVPEGFVEKIIHYLRKETDEPFIPASNYFSALSCHDALVDAHGSLATLACALTKIATDLSFLGSGPRCGLGELFFPENEPGSSIMPGKVNPTQCEALQMVCAQVLGNNQTVIIGGSRGNFELNVMKPVIIYNFLQSVDLLSEGMRAFSEFFVKGLKVNKARLQDNINNSLMLVTALAPVLGYDKCSKAALKAFHESISLKEACLALGYLSEKEFDRLVVPENMVGNH